MPVIVGAGKAVDRCSDGIVKLVKVDRPAHFCFVEQAGELLQAGGRDAFQGAQEMPGLDLIEAVGEMMAAGGKIERGAHGGNPGDVLGG